MTVGVVAADRDSDLTSPPVTVSGVRGRRTGQSLTPPNMIGSSPSMAEHALRKHHRLMGKRIPTQVGTR
ncbi:MAG: hypothetical protein QOE27_818 [Solirubrobacteraceae bacterium]|nr:hypothetical protein [Solirubrobacteraceae bacterium]